MFVYFFLVALILTSLIWIHKFVEDCFYGYDCEDFQIDRCIVAVIFSALVTLWGLKKKSLALSGAIGGIFVGLILTYSSYCFVACLFTFFFTSSKATHFHSSRKKKLEVNFKEGGQRNWIQVVCNGGTATEIALIYMLNGGCGEIPLDFNKNYLRSWLAAAVLSALASANGDTWASELSILAQSKPRLITTFQKVPIGTNGGVTSIGVLCSAFGGLLVGLSYFVTLFSTVPYFSVIEQAVLSAFIGISSGLFGSFLDSLLGATLQYSGLDPRSGKIVEKPGPGIKHIAGIPILDNHSVNLLMTLIISIAVPTVTAELYSYFR
ncbi:transmembrane protein 19 [Parasteatoda tepidariorum]|uniref:transmembrane protein 19 n=1 Tax=Parasteatoda tepidariorum TaxID=114398 RepID=UPI00077F8A23|nr:transmembrane protein 19 [Parasteatoda tepidariorum]